MRRTRQLLAAAEVFEPRGTALTTARSLLALAELTVLLGSSDRILFGAGPGASPSKLCSGIGATSLWCITGTDSHSLLGGRIIAVTILAAVVVGLWPRWLCVPHWYVAFSLATRMTTLNGGEEVAQIVTLLLIPMCLGDSRWCHWQKPDHPMAPAWRGSAYAAHLLLRCQCAIIYLVAALSKLAYSSWRAGTAVPILLNNAQFGLPPGVRSVVEHLLAPARIGAVVTWAVVALEITIATTMLFTTRGRRAGLALAICLHSAIIIAMGLFSFGLVMISLVMAVSGGGTPWETRDADSPVLRDLISRTDPEPRPALNRTLSGKE
jgi:antimicrobial peptide system SdpB family protein